jgi:GTP pyrophosphokinase
LEDLAFKYLHPDLYEDIQRKIAKKEGEDEYIDEVNRILMKKFYENHIDGEVTGRIKQIYSLYLKMTDQNINLIRFMTSPPSGSL